MIYKSLSLALASATTVASAPSSYYSSVTTGLESYRSQNLGIFEGRGYYEIIQATADPKPNLHRVSLFQDASHDLKTTPSLAAPSGFTGASIGGMAYISDFNVPMKAPPTLFAGWYTNIGVGTVAVYQGDKRTSLAKWSQVQTLNPPSEFREAGYFGAVAVDQSTHRKVAIGCSGCNATAGGGQIYLYSTTPTGTSWSQTQVLQIQADLYGGLGYDTVIHDNVVLGRVKLHTNNQIAYVGFVRGPGLEDPYVPTQVFSAKHGLNISDIDVYEETIVIASLDETVGSVANAGEVYILYPSTEEFKLKPAGKPRPVQWSVQQVLRAPTPDHSFGISVSIDRNTLVVTEATDKTYVYQRKEQAGKWSLQQVLDFASGNNAVVAGNRVAIGTGSSLAVYDLTTNWDCVIISLEDQFGDGWDTAQLLVNAPDGTQDYFAQSCEMTNPLQIRYCPNLASDGGLYSFSLPGALKSKFYWELQWGIFVERTGTWYQGQWDTKMDFHWDPETLAFTPRKIERVLYNSTCVPCKTRPTEKPTPVLRRLKGSSSGTQHPTISPAPTLAVSTSFNWRYLNLKATAGNPWFDKFNRGTSYYVSDAHGHKLVTSGTLCEAETDKQCWVDLPDGEYILRVSGALSTHKSGQTFSYCKGVADKTTQQQMTFRIAEDDCSIVTLASRGTVCQSLGFSGLASFYLVLNVNMILHGTTVTSVTNAENLVFAEAVASMIPGLVASDVTLVSASPSGSSTFLNANIRLSSALGYNVLDIDGEAALEAYIKTIFTSQSKESSLAASLGAGSVASAFSHVTRVEFVDYRLVDSVEVVAQSDVDMVASFADSESVNSAAASKSSSSVSLFYDSALVGYLVAGVGIILVVGFFLRSPRSTDNAVELSSSRPSGAGARSRDFAAVSLTPKDLQELAQMEQEYLRIVSK